MLFHICLIGIVAAASGQQQHGVEGHLPGPAPHEGGPAPIEGGHAPNEGGHAPQGQFPFLEVPPSQWPFYPVLPQFENTYNYDYGEITPSTLVEDLVQSEPKEPSAIENECREEQYVCTRLYSINKPCKECIKSLCFYRSLRVYVINKEICVRTLCEQDEIQKAALCKDRFQRCGAMAAAGMCRLMHGSCGHSCGDC